MPDSEPIPPEALGAAGGKLWAAVHTAYELDVHEELLLLEACRCADVLDRLDELVRRHGLVSSSPQGERVHPALVEARQQQLTLTRLLAALRLPEDEAGLRPQQRGAARGAYMIRGGAS